VHGSTPVAMAVGRQVVVGTMEPFVAA
jgi:hypothetical protein